MEEARMGFAADRRRFLVRFSGWLGGIWLVGHRSPGWSATDKNTAFQGGSMNLPLPRMEGAVSLEQAIMNRRTVRAFRSTALAPGQVSQLLWAAQGITADRGALRAAPSAGALYPMDVYVVVGKKGVDGIEAGVYHYGSRKHRLSAVSGGDVRERVARAALSQKWMARAPINLVITAEYRRITAKYGKRGVRYAMIEAGHIGQNVFLQAEALGLKAGIVGAFDDKGINRALNIQLSHEPLLVMPVGYRR
jgi:SagB-type dehydrogenase family enzyme